MRAPVPDAVAPTAVLLATLIGALTGAATGQSDRRLEEFTPPSWSARGPYANDPADIAQVRRTRGVLPIADGRVFAHVGYGEPANRMFMITGPSYQTRGNHAPHGAFGELWLEVHGPDGPLAPATRNWSGVARAAAARTEEVFADRTALATFDIATGDAILRKITIITPEHHRRLVVRMSTAPDGAAEFDAARGLLTKQHRRDATRVHHLAVGFLDPDRRAAVEPTEGGFAIPIPRGLSSLTLVLQTATDGATAAAKLAALAGADPFELQQEALSRWRDELRDTITVTPDGPLRRHVEAVKLATLAQRSEHGGVAPMVNFKGVWARDSNGPIRTLLWAGRFDLVRDLLRYYRYASAQARHTHREFPLDLDVGPDDDLDAAGWATTGTDRCEVPSYVALQHAWFFARSGDRAFLDEAWPYVLQNATAQVAHPGPHGPLQPFNGDETYLHGAFYSLFPQKGVWPNDLPSVGAWSLDSLLAWQAALTATADLAAIRGDSAWASELHGRAATVRTSIEETFWLADEGRYAPALSAVDLTPHRSPFAPLNLRPLWLGTHRSDEPRALANLLGTIGALRRSNGSPRMTPSVGWYIGALPGYWLANLAAVDHPLAWEVVDDVLATAAVDGTWAEVHAPDGPSWGYGDGVLPNRYRPWESGLVLDATLDFLTGMRVTGGDHVWLHPRKPDGLEVATVGPIRVGGTRFELRYPPGATGDVEVVHLSGPPLVVQDDWFAAGATLRVPLATPRDLPTPPPERVSTALDLPAGDRLIVTTRAEPDPEPGDVLLDAGLPFRPADLACAMFEADGEPRYRTVVLEPRSREATRDTLKPAAFWSAPILQEAFARLEQRGGRVFLPELLTDWQVAGPFPNPDSRGLDQESRPVTEPFDPDTRFEVPGQDTAARWWPMRAHGGRLDLHLPDGPRDDVAVFARTVIHADAGRQATLLFGSDDGCKVWWNGRPVFQSIEHRHLIPDQFRIPVTLRAGANVLMIGVEQRSGAFGLAARIR